MTNTSCTAHTRCMILFWQRLNSGNKIKSQYLLTLNAQRRVVGWNQA